MSPSNRVANSGSSRRRGRVPARGSGRALPARGRPVDIAQPQPGLGQARLVSKTLEDLDCPLGVGRELVGRAGRIEAGSDPDRGARRAWSSNRSSPSARASSIARVSTPSRAHQLADVGRGGGEIGASSSRAGSSSRRSRWLLVSNPTAADMSPRAERPSACRREGEAARGGEVISPAHPAGHRARPVAVRLLLSGSRGSPRTRAAGRGARPRSQSARFSCNSARRSFASP